MTFFHDIWQNWNKTIPIWLQKIAYLESAQKTESIDVCFELFCRVLFSIKFLALIPPRYMWKNDIPLNRCFIVWSSVFLSSYSISHSRDLLSTVQMPFWFNSFFHISLGGTTVKNLIEKKSRRNSPKHTWVDSDFCADSKYAIFWSKIGIVLFKFCQISWKKVTNQVSRIVCLEFW